MKYLHDGTQISERSFYYLLTWCENDLWRYMNNTFGKTRLLELTINEYMDLFSYVVKKEMSCLSLQL